MHKRILDHAAQAGNILGVLEWLDRVSTGTYDPDPMKGFLIDLSRKVMVKYPRLGRLLWYRDPRKYWNERAKGYYAEQEALEERNARSKYIASRLLPLEFNSILEIGCGYGKQLKNLKRHPHCLVVGIDWSELQLKKATEVCQPIHPVLIGADATQLPFRDRTFDLILTSAVIMHQPQSQAKQIIREILRVGNRYVAHNEDTDTASTYTRHGYDMGETYRVMGIKVLESGPIPLNPPIGHTQFTIAELTTTDFLPESPQDIPLQYHNAKS
jgi:SAM-dependent methyltransferase